MRRNSATDPKPTATLETADLNRQSSASMGYAASLQAAHSGQHPYARQPAVPLPLQHGVMGPPPPIPPPLSAQPSSQVSEPTKLTGSSQPKGSSSSNKRTPCPFYMKTGNCAFGTECKFEHPLDQPATQYNTLGLPLRPGEPDCAYYVRNLHCGYGASCKFNHSEPVYSWMPLPMAEGMGLPLSASGVPLGYSGLPGTHAPVHMAPHAMLPAISQAQLQMLSPAGPMPIGPGMTPQMGHFLTPAHMLHGNPAMLQPIPQMLQPIPQMMLQQMAAAQHGVPPAMYPTLSPLGSGAMNPALSPRQLSRPIINPQVLHSRPDLRTAYAAQTSDSSGNARSQDSRQKRRSRSKHGSMSSSERLNRGYGGEGSGQTERSPAARRENLKGLEAEMHNSGSGSSASVSGGVEKLSQQAERLRLDATKGP